jgi:hypothetical protein
MQTNAPWILAHHLWPGWEFVEDAKIVVGDDVAILGEIRKVIRIDPWPREGVVGIGITDSNERLPLVEGGYTERRIPKGTP